MTAGASRFTDLRDHAVDLGFAAGWGTVKAVPQPVATRAFQAAADRATHRNGPATRQLRANLRRVLGPSAGAAELEDVLAAAMRSYARYWLETFRLPKIDKARLVADVESKTTGAHHIDAAVESGRGFVIALPHMGNWDVAGLWLINRYQRPFTTVAERLKPESLFDRFVAYREGLGMEVLALTGGQQPPMSLLVQRLKAGGGVCLVADRDLSRRGVPVNFFGATARMPGGPALLAALTGAALMTVGLWFDGAGWGQRIGAPIELAGKKLADRVAVGTQAVADQFADAIAAHPSDWHMLQRLWTADLNDRSGAVR